MRNISQAPDGATPELARIQRLEYRLMLIYMRWTRLAADLKDATPHRRARILKCIAVLYRRSVPLAEELKAVRNG